MLLWIKNKKKLGLIDKDNNNLLLNQKENFHWLVEKRLELNEKFNCTDLTYYFRSIESGKKSVLDFDIAVHFFENIRDGKVTPEEAKRGRMI